MKGKLYKENDSYTLFVDGKIFGDTRGHHLSSITNTLSVKNCREIERGYDLDELVKREYLDGYDTTELCRTAFKDGFQKALEILGDKKFSEEDIEKAIEFGHKTYHSWKDRNEEKFIQSLQQTEWEVDIEMEYVGECNGNNDEGCFQDSSGHNCGCFKRKPKLDATGCLILKRI
jgi:hypothetical protein